MERTEASGFPDVPPPPTTPPRASGTVELRVGKRLLWVGDVAYPLENIARVHTYMLTPRRWEATRHFLRRIGLILSVAFALTILGGITGLAGQDTAGKLVMWMWLGASATLLFCAAEWLQVVTAAPLYVLAVETSGPPMAVVTSPDPRRLDQLVGSIVHAIEHPETEFHVTVDRLMVNPKNYYFGDNVNMYGGIGNVGVDHA
ncbi:DUF6232 family protein [Streptomyces sp. NPDC050548]|uniref:DUF6232 family protein n=1 Tax=Streptomyces sp. NPDC050548 TaxID=3365629 RepID=UPI0037B08DB5